VLTKPDNWTRSWQRWILFTSANLFLLRSIIILSFYLRIGLPIGVFPSGFSIINFYIYLISPMRGKRHVQLFSQFYYFK
jgi:hypothetical protein